MCYWQEFRRGDIVSKVRACMRAKSLQLHLTLCHPMACSPAGSSVRGILQARILGWVAMSFSRGSSRPRDLTRVSRIGGRRLNVWATREDMYITIYKIESQWGFVVWHRELIPLLCDNLKGWNGVGDGREVQERDTSTYGWFMLMYRRNQHNFVKQLSSN